MSILRLPRIGKSRDIARRHGFEAARSSETREAEEEDADRESAGENGRKRRAGKKGWRRIGRGVRLDACAATARRRGAAEERKRSDKAI